MRLYIFEGYKMGHTNEGNIDTARGEGASLGRPAETVLSDPGIEAILLFLGQTKIR